MPYEPVPTIIAGIEYPSISAAWLAISGVLDIKNKSSFQRRLDVVYDGNVKKYRYDERKYQPENRCYKNSSLTYVEIILVKTATNKADYAYLLMRGSIKWRALQYTRSGVSFPELNGLTE